MLTANKRWWVMLVKGYINIACIVQLFCKCEIYHPDP